MQHSAAQLGVSLQDDPDANEASHPLLVRYLFAATLFLSAFLLFVIQPLTARLVLPVLGGSAAVWTTSLVFFQVVLVVGYGWAHVSRALPARVQLLLQPALLAAAAWMLPAHLIAIDIPDEPTVGALIRLLFMLVGLPAFAVAVNSSLLQRWFAYSGAHGAADPSFLYAFSNAGSFLGLMAYPFALEPVLTLTQQRLLWGICCAVLAALVALCGLPLWLQRKETVERELPGSASLPLQTRVEWFVLGLVPASLLAGVTAYLSTELLPMPLLWVVPLSIYLLTFVTSFSGRVLRMESRPVRALPLIAVPLLVWQFSGGAPLWASLGVHLVVFGAIAALCHGRLSDSRPGPARLTEFYLWIASGGAAGGAINALLAPAIFTTPAEYALMLVAAAIVVASRRADSTRAFRLAFGLLVVMTASWVLQSAEPRPGLAMVPLLLVFAAGALRPAFRVVLACLLAVVIGKVMATVGTAQVLTVRSVFAALRVIDDWHPGVRALVHGSTVHGLQALDPAASHEPRSYFARTGPIGQVMTALTPQLAAANVGVIGLGAGELAAYAAEGQHWTFYEIDPEVVNIAANPKLFTYLRDARAETRIVLGDGRRSILREHSREPFALLVLDAFSSDSIPVHLLTLEAFRGYAGRLSQNGIIAVHISNRFLDLRPVLAAAAAELGFAGLWRFDSGSRETAGGRYPSQWVIMGLPGSLPEAIRTNDAWTSFEETDRTVRWTDERATLFHVLK